LPKYHQYSGYVNVQIMFIKTTKNRIIMRLLRACVKLNLIANL